MIIKKGNLIYKNKVFECELPASIISVLTTEKIIKNINEYDNVESIINYLLDDVTFTFDINLSQKELDKKYIDLVLSHIDTIGEIYLNEKEILRVNNAHKTYRINVKKYINNNKNILKIVLHSAVKYIEKEEEKYNLWGLGAPNTIPGYGHIRKCYCTFGWDWAPMIPDIGIDDVIEIDAYDSKIFDVVTSQKVDEDATLFIDAKCLGTNKINYTFLEPNGKKIEEGYFDNKAKIVVKNPKIWWPINLGDQYLYKLILSLDNGFKKEINIGFRTVELIKEKDEIGESFYFKINGIKTFLFGANYIPTSLVLPYSSSKKTSKRIIQDCVFANFNSIRVWGGGIYPDESFYNECDKQGILVFQDFMFSGTAINLTNEFKENALSEVEEVTKKLCNHPSLFYWCGNNECEFFLSLWKNNSDMMKNKNANKMLKDNVLLFEKLIPNKIKSIFNDLPYSPSSQSKLGGYNEIFNDNLGDSHSWDVWAARAPIEKYYEHYSRFCDEFGFASMPSKEACLLIGKSQKEIQLHEVHADGYNNLKNYIKDYYGATNDDDLIYKSQVLQSDAITLMVNHLRSNKPTCMGSYYWCLNDIWPCIALSSLDYFGNYKALHYKLRRTQKPISISYDIKDGVFYLYLDNNSLVGEKCKFEVVESKKNFEEVSKIQNSIYIGGGQNEIIYCAKVEDLLNRGVDFVAYRLNNENFETYPLIKMKNMERKQINLQKQLLKKDNNFYELKLTSSVYLRNVMVYINDKLVDCMQCFDISNEKTITIKFKNNQKIDMNDIQIKYI